MECPHCGEYNPDDAVYCGYCGGQMLFVCSECETLNDVSRFYCGRCGAELRQESAALTPATGEMEQFLTTLPGVDAGPQRPSLDAARRRIFQEEERVRQEQERERERERRERERLAARTAWERFIEEASLGEKLIAMFLLTIVFGVALSIISGLVNLLF